MRMDKKYFMIGMLMLLVVQMSFIIGQENGTKKEPDRKGNYVSDAGVEYDFEILDYFNNQTLVEELISRPLRSHATSLEIIDNETWVSVIIDLKDFSEADNVLSIFSEEEIKDITIRNLSKGIGVDLTEEAFFKLVNDERVDKIYYSHPIYLLKGRELDKNLFIILSLLGIFILFILIIYFIIKKLKSKKIK